MERQILERGSVVEDVTIRHYRAGDVPMLADLINEADDYDQFGWRTTVESLQHEWDDPLFVPERDGFVAVFGAGGAERAVALGDVFYLPTSEESAENITVFCWHIVHPKWRGAGLGRQILARCYQRAREIVGDIDDPRPKLFRAMVGATDHHGARRARDFGMEHVRTFYRMEYAPLNGRLPAPEVPEGLSIVPWSPAYDQATLDAFNESFRDHWGWREVSDEVWQHHFHGPGSRPDLWRIALDGVTGEIAGLCIVTIDAEVNAQLGRQEGWIRDLGVRRPWRKRGLGTALLLSGMVALREAGMTSVRLGVDSDSLTNATRLYERVGYRVANEFWTYHKPLR